MKGDGWYSFPPPKPGDRAARGVHFLSVLYILGWSTALKMADFHQKSAILSAHTTSADDQMRRQNRLQWGRPKSAWAQTCSQPWRMLSLTIHVNAEPVDLGITTPKNMILADIILPDCRMMGQWLVPLVDE